MLAILAFIMVATFMTLIMTKRLPALVALILVPTVFAGLTGHALGLGDMMLEGVRQLAPTGVMLLFAILYFGFMLDVGLFDPVTRMVVKRSHGDPVRIAVGSAILALVVSFDGDGTTTYMITVAALLPLYRQMRMDVRVMACILIMSNAVMNIVPWGGPTARAAIALHLDARDLFIAMIPAMLCSAVWVLAVAYMLGVRERNRLAALPAATLAALPASGSGGFTDTDADSSIRRPKLFWFNAALTLALMGTLIFGDIPLPVLFMVAFAIAATVNYPQIDLQKERVTAHAGNALATVSLVFAAGIFTGILQGTEMVDAMAATVIQAIPPAMGPYLAPITALISIPATFLISNDAFYFGMLPILAQTATEYGIAPIHIARASLVGQQVHLLSPLVASTYLLVGMANIELGDHQRFTLKWALGSCMVFFVACILFGIFPWHA